MKKPVPFNPTNRQLEEYVGNVTYGAFMIREISSKVLREDVCGWAQRESFLIHARSFLDFFTTKKQNRRREDLLAADYAPNWSTAISETRLNVLKRESVDINTFVAHISYGRQKKVKNLGHRKKWPETDIAKKLQEEWDDFFRVQVDPKFKTFFPEWKLITFP